MKKWLIYTCCAVFGLSLLAPAPAQARKKKNQDRNYTVAEFQAKSRKDKIKADKKARKAQHKAAKEARKEQRRNHH
ncbi:MAG: hypothetical protein P4M01_02600 [Acidobacteriota bacterium]|nr:hypothetical protein [Acidobacteriota bacterium]